jgi:hypothetical protein
MKTYIISIWLVFYICIGLFAVKAVNAVMKQAVKALDTQYIVSY